MCEQYWAQMLRFLTAPIGVNIPAINPAMDRAPELFILTPYGQIRPSILSALIIICHWPIGAMAKPIWTRSKTIATRRTILPICKTIFAAAKAMTGFMQTNRTATHKSVHLLLTAPIMSIGCFGSKIYGTGGQTPITTALMGCVRNSQQTGYRNQNPSALRNWDAPPLIAALISPMYLSIREVQNQPSPFTPEARATTLPSAPFWKLMQAIGKTRRTIQAQTFTKEPWSMRTGIIFMPLMHGRFPPFPRAPIFGATARTGPLAIGSMAGLAVRPLIDWWNVSAKSPGRFRSIPRA